jgi:hypothetical protein
VPDRRSCEPPVVSTTLVAIPVARRPLEEVLRVLKKLLVAAVAAGALAALRKRSSGKAENNLWHEATRGPDAVSTPTAL